MPPAGSPGRPAYGAIALDLDGTLLEGDKTLHPRAAACLCRAMAAGVRVALLSGRMYASMLPYWEALQPGTPVVSYNGGLIRHPQQGVLYHNPLAVETARALLAFCEGEGIHVNAYIDDQLYVAADGGLGRWYSDVYGAGLTAVGRLSAWLTEPSTKLLAIAPSPAAFPDMFARLEAFLATADLPVRLCRSHAQFAELIHPATSKGAALRWLADHTGVPLAAWVAAGDAGNDVEMIAAAGLGLAVAGSEAAGHPCDGTIPAGHAGMEHIVEEVVGV